MTLVLDVVLLNYFVQRWRPSYALRLKTLAPAIDGVKGSTLGKKGRRRPPCINPTVVSIVGGSHRHFFWCRIGLVCLFRQSFIGLQNLYRIGFFCLLARDSFLWLREEIPLVYQVWHPLMCVIVVDLVRLVRLKLNCCCPFWVFHLPTYGCKIPVLICVWLIRLKNSK